MASSIVSEPAAHVALTPGREISLKCEVADFPEVTFTWHRRARKFRTTDTEEEVKQHEEAVTNKENKYEVSNNNLVLKSPNLSDIGEYICRASGPTNVVGELLEHEKVIQVRPRPHIYEFDLESSTTRSAVVEEGTTMRLVCNVKDDSVDSLKLTITWQMSKYDENDMNDIHSGEEGIRIESYNLTSHALIIDKLSKDHRRFYRCNVTNGITDNSKVILIRVKNKYTVIWPTVGIVIELVILLGVIFVVDSRKVEPDLEKPNRKIIQM